MTASDNRHKDVSSVFQQRRRKVLRLAVPYIVAIVVILLLQTLHVQRLAGVELKYFVFVYVGAVVGFIMVARKNWRCPACDEILGRDHDPHFCRNCGAKLR